MWASFIREFNGDSSVPYSGNMNDRWKSEITPQSCNGATHRKGVVNSNGGSKEPDIPFPFLKVQRKLRQKAKLVFPDYRGCPVFWCMWDKVWIPVVHMGTCRVT